MSDQLVPVQPDELTTYTPPELDPVRTYLLTLRSQASRSTMRKRAEQIASTYLHSHWDVFPWHTLTKSMFEFIIDKELERVSVPYTNQMIACLKGIMGACFDLKLISGDHLLRIKRVKSHPTDGLLSGRYISHEERALMLGVCQADAQPIGFRDASILSLMFALGLRRVEIRALDLVDVDSSGDDQWVITIPGKGDKRRRGYVNGGALRYLREWLHVRGDWDGCLFCTCHQSGSLRPNYRISDRGTYGIFQRRAQEAGIAYCRPHDARRSWVTSHLEAGTDLFIVALLAGHSDIATTRRYDRRPEQAAKQAARGVNVPYLPRE